MRPRQEEAPFDKEIQELDRQVFQIQNLVMKFKKMVDQLGTGHDTTDLRAKISLSKNTTQRQAKDVKDKLFTLNNQKVNLSERQQTRIQRAAQNFAVVLEDFQRALRLAAEREEFAPAKPPVASNSVGPDPNAEMEKEALLQYQQQQEVAQLENLVEHNEAVIDERDQEITSLIREIGEINEMFQDVAVLVHDQGQMIDDIETNITRTADQVEVGKQELVQAERHQKKATNKMLWIVLIISVVVAVVVVVVLSSILG